MNIQVKAIDLSSKKERSHFVDLPWSLYKDYPHWVPPLKMAVHDLLNEKKHPFYQTAKVQAFIAFQNDKMVGRIMAIHNSTYNQYEDNKIGHFGFFECIDDLNVASALLEHAQKWLSQKGLTSMMGPMNPGTNYECGLLVNSYDDPPQVMMTYNPPYYVTLLEKCGLTKAMDLLAYKVDARFNMPKIILDIADRTEKKSAITYRTLNLKDWNNELDKMYEIYNSAWEDNWGFVPMAKEEFYHTAKDLKSIVDPTLVHFAMVNNKEAGFILTLPDLNQVFHTIKSGRLSPLAVFKILTAKKRMNRVRVITLGIKKEFRKMGLETLLYKHNHEAIKKYAHINEIEMSWILETNLEMNKPLIRMGGPAYKTYRLLQKQFL
jgi:hypothetical protein